MKSNKSANRIRIIGGDWRSRIITFPAVEGLRPTSDRVRETLFNWLGQTLYGKACLDLFAGSGVLGFEALSRGAERVVMVENTKTTVESLKQNAATLSAERLVITNSDALSFLKVAGERFDIIFLDPPYQAKLLPTLFPMLSKRLKPEGTVYFESDQSEELPPDWKIIKEGRAGRVRFQLARYIEADSDRTLNPDIS
ncbi:MAG: 16S rRNA (guanine(966)-N(2))-methyltransferase RsmD [Pseudomonadota bacterium]